ncbi:MAG: diguanylate cyclase [Thermodesulfobacteriota bacterium]
MADETLFSQETQVIQDAEALLEQQAYADDPLYQPYQELLNEYKRLFRHTKRLVRMGDRMQSNLNELNKELQTHKKILSAMSYQDGLTGIANRRRLNETLEAEWNRGLRNGESLALVFLDLDFFKQYNDNYGHGAGDECLIQVAQALTRSAQRCNDLVARYGGEEFVLLLPETELEGARKVAHTVQRNIQELALQHEYSAVASVVTVSVGVAVAVPHAEHNFQELIQAADEQLYVAKEAGRNQIQEKVLDYDA